MSTIVDFYLAADLRAARAGPRRDGDDAEWVRWGDFDAEWALVEWECLLTDAAPHEIPEHDGEEGRPFELRGELVTALRYATPARLGGLAESWAAGDGEELDVEVAREILGDLARLARNASGRGMGVYCRVG